jgi:hypothetical protein
MIGLLILAREIVRRPHQAPSYSNAAGPDRDRRPRTGQTSATLFRGANFRRMTRVTK